jgi:cytoskeletal protein CcmA (bactofilin family)
MSFFGKKEEPVTPKAVGVPPAAQKPPEPVPVKEAIQMSTLPSRMPEQRFDNANSAVIGKSVVVKGQILSREDLTIEGEVEGTVELHEHRLTVGLNGKVSAGVKARELVVLGSVHGNVDITDKIDIRKDAKLVGDIKTARIVIEDGAFFKGNIDIVRPEPSRQAAPPPAAPKPQATASGSASTATAPAVTAGAGDAKR